MPKAFTIRDQFALAVVQGAHASTHIWTDPESLAEHAYAIADAMLAARVAKRDGHDGGNSPPTTQSTMPPSDIPPSGGEVDS